jgi:hypothetical protein
MKERVLKLWTVEHIEVQKYAPKKLERKPASFE